MTQADISAEPRVSLNTRMCVGAGIGLLLISFFLVAGQPNPEWERLWKIRPLIVGPFAGAMGGLVNYFILRYHSRFGINRIIALMLSLFIFIFGLWIGMILGFSGTYWD